MAFIDPFNNDVICGKALKSGVFVLKREGALSRNFHSMKFLLIWYKDSFRVPDMNFNEKSRGHRVRLVRDML